jgi:pimeloyl-ACP methyl ester carboxylesterase
MRIRGVAVALLVLGGAAGCSSGSGSTSSTIGPTTTSTAAETTSTARSTTTTDPIATTVEERTIDVEDPTLGPLHFRALAAGDPAAAEQGRLVLFLHGFPQTAEAYRAMLPKVAAEGYYAVAFDQRGYSPGARPTDVEAYQLAAMIHDVTGVADALGATTFHVVGHDWGGGLAWIVANVHPDRVTSLTALSTPHPDAFNEAVADPSNPQHEASAYMRRLADVTRQQAEGGIGAIATAIGPTADSPPDREVALYATALAAPGATDAALNWYRANPLPSTAEAGPTRVPTLFIRGVDDPYLLRDAALATEDHVDAPYTFLELDGVDHWVPERAPDRVADALISQLDATS